MLCHCSLPITTQYTTHCEQRLLGRLLTSLRVLLPAVLMRANIFDDTDFGDSGLMQSATIDFGTMDFIITNLDFTDASSMDFSAIDLGRMSAAPMDSGVMDTNTLGDLGASESVPIHSACTVRPHSLINNGMDNESMDIGALENDTICVPGPHHDTVRSSTFDISNKDIGIAGNQQMHVLDRTLQPSAAGQCNGAIEVGYIPHYRSMTRPHPELPWQICPGNSTTRGWITSDYCREYRSECLDLWAARAKITADDWQEYRPFLEQLYIVEKVKLKDVMQILKIKFGFVATYVLLVHFSFSV